MSVSDRDSFVVVASTASTWLSSEPDVIVSRTSRWAFPSRVASGVTSMRSRCVPATARDGEVQPVPVTSEVISLAPAISGL